MTEPKVRYPRVTVVVCGTTDETGVSDKKSKDLLEALEKANLSGLVEYRGPLEESDVTGILGWTEEPEGEDWGETYHVKDRYGKKVRLANNPHNRPFYPSLAEGYVQEHLNRRWRFNGETIILGKYGNLNDRQHTLVAFKLACQEVAKYPEKWVEKWPDGKVTMSGIVVCGVSEDDEVVNTINTGKSRSVADVIYRTDLFSKMNKSRQVLAAKILDYAVKRLWVRTGVYRDNEAPRRTHSEVMDFVERHRSLLRAVKFVMGPEPKMGPKPKGDDDKPTAELKQYVPLGYAAAMLYLMSVSNTPFDRYYKEGGSPKDSRLDFSNRELAEQFWTDVVTSPKLKVLRNAISEIGGWHGQVDVVDWMVCAAWKNYKDGKSVTPKTVEVKYSKPDRKRRSYPIDSPTVLEGELGIDLGEEKSAPEPKVKEKKVKGERKPRVTPPSPEEVEREKEKIHAENNGEALNRLKLEHPEVTVFLFKSVAGSTWYARDGYADLVGSVIKRKSLADTDGVLRVDIRGGEIDDAVKLLADAGHTVAKCQEMGDGFTTEIINPKEKP